MPATLDAPPPAPAATPPAAPQTPPPAKTNMESAFEGLESKAKPPSLEQPPIPDHPGQKEIRDREAREKAEAEATAKKAREERGEEEDEEEETKPPTPEELKAKQEAEAKKANEAKEQKQETPPPKKKGDFLREELAKVKSERDNFKAEIEKLKTAPKGDDPEKKALQEKIAAMEKRHAEIEDDYRLHSYEKSDDYKKNFLKPYEDAYMRGAKKALGLQVNTPEGTLRPATQDDFVAVVSTVNDDQATRLAEELFGRNAAIVIHHRERILEANEARAHAIEEAKTTGVKKIKEQEETTTKQREAIKTKFMATVAEREQKLEFLKPVEGDAAWNEALDRGKKLADRSWLARDGKTPDEQAEIDAANYARARAYSPLKLSVKRLRAENAELKAKLEKYKTSSPGDGQGKVNPEGQPPPPANAMEGAFASIEQRAKPPQFY